MFYGSSPICMLVFAYVYGVAPHPHIALAGGRKAPLSVDSDRKKKKKKN